MRASGVLGLLIYCSDYHCSHWTAISGDRWADDVRLSDLEPLPSLRPKECGRQPNFHWKQEARRAQWASDQRG
jgi:hypothetical protein